MGTDNIFPVEIWFKNTQYIYGLFRVSRQDPPVLPNQPSKLGMRLEQVNGPAVLLYFYSLPGYE